MFLLVEKIFVTGSGTSHLKMYALLCRTCGSIIVFPDVTLERCALSAGIQHFVLSFSISYWDLIKFPSFVDTTKRGVRGVKGGPKTGWLYRQLYWVKFEPNFDARSLSFFFKSRASQPTNETAVLASCSTLAPIQKEENTLLVFLNFLLCQNSQRHNFVLEKLRCLTLSLTYHSPILTRSWKKQRDHGLLDGFLKLLMLVLPQAPQPLSLSLSLCSLHLLPTLPCYPLNFFISKRKRKG
jgi:hypothetical protein